MRNLNTEVEQFKRDELKKLYDRLTEKQQAFFRRLWKSVEEIPEESINVGFDQCQRTLLKNGKKVY